jgi:putative DNA primase/helicase
MGLILSHAKRLSAGVQGLVVLVHHTGKDAARGLRGHSSLFAALDGAIEVSRDALGNRGWSVAKSKDGQDGVAHNFSLKVHTLGKDADGDEITSCSVERTASAIFIPPPAVGEESETGPKRD